MAFTDKQVRNGADQGGGGQNTAQPGPDSTGMISAAKSQAQNVGGPTVGPHFEWDSGLAISDVEGGGSG